MLNMLAILAEYERKLILECVRAGVAVAQEAGTQFGRPKSGPAVVVEKLAIVAAARAEGTTAEKAASLVGWSRPMLYRHQNALAPRNASTAAPAVS
jgi:DNA invertase Pin-like site-specific DNA recombinase